MSTPGKTFRTEAELCAAYSDFARACGWVVYPETAGFDMLLVRPEGDEHAGTQIGIEAKLKLNMKVVDQILDPTPYSTQWERGPDYRAILVGSVGGGAGVVRLLSRCGVTTIAPQPMADILRGSQLWPESRSDCDKDWYVEGSHHEGPWTDLNPAMRCELPEFLPTVAAGVPSPIQLSKWKIGALRVLATLELAGGISRPEIKHFGCDPSAWTRGPTRWLDPSDAGQWVKSERLPKFDQQHPEIYAHVLAEQRAKLSKEIPA